jgi:hypothetical protein
MVAVVSGDAMNEPYAKELLERAEGLIELLLA